MTLWGLLGSLFFQLMLGYVLFMLVVFSACGLGSNPGLKKWQRAILDRCMLLVPGSAAAVAVLLVVLYLRDSIWLSWWWNLLPLGVVALYLAGFVALTRALRRQAEEKDAE